MERFLAMLARSLPVILWIAGIAAGLMSLFFIHRALRRFTIGKLVYKRGFSSDCVCEGDEVTLTETLWNPTPFFAFFVDVESYYYSGLEVDGVKIEKGGMRRLVSRFHLRPFEKISKTVNVLCVKRGTYKLSSAMIYRTGGERWLGSETEIAGGPKLADLKKAIPGALGTGETSSRRRLIYDPFEVNGVRDYTPSDPFRFINFKASARLSVGGAPHLVVNNYDYCSSARCFVYQNFHLPAYSGISYDEYEELMEDGLSISASLVAAAIDIGGLCSFSANCETVEGKKSISFPALGGDVHKKEILSGMAAIRAADGASFSSMMARDISRGIFNSEIFIITAFPDEQISAAASYYERNGNSVSIITLKGDAR